MEDLQLTSDVGQLAVRGVVDPSFLSAAAVVGVANGPAIDAAAQHNLEIRGEFDLAKLAAMLPHALAIREGRDDQLGHDPTGDSQSAGEWRADAVGADSHGEAGGHQRRQGAELGSAGDRDV